MHINKQICLMKKKPLLVVRRSGYYVNTIQNASEMKKNWLENNLPRTKKVIKADNSVILNGRSLRESMKACFISFTPATEAEAANAPVFDGAMAKSYGPGYQIKKKRKSKESRNILLG